MSDFGSMAAAVQSFKVAFDLLKDIREVAKKLEHAELQLKLADLATTLAEAKLKIADVQEENLSLRGQVAQLSIKKNLRSQVTLRDNTYIPQGAPIEGYGSGPWCTKCFDTDGMLVTLHHMVASSFGVIGGRGSTSYKWQCPHCKSEVAAGRR